MDMLINLSVAIILQCIGISKHPGNYPATQWLGLHALTAKSLVSIPGWETKVPQAAQCRKKKNPISGVPVAPLLTGRHVQAGLLGTAAFCLPSFSL